MQVMNFNFSAVILSKYEISYFKCECCGLMQTEKPYWLEAAYGAAIASLDVGLVQRNIVLSGVVSRLTSKHFDPLGKYLDFAGGYGLFVRLMRDKGYDFYRHDKYCENIFSEYFDESSLSNGKLNYEIVTAFEVMEHVFSTVEELFRLFKITDTVVFSTEILPSGITSTDDWWYFVPETGQHITFYTIHALNEIANRLSVNFYTNGKSLHMMTRRDFEDNPFISHIKMSIIDRIRMAISKKISIHLKPNKVNSNISTENDFQYIKKEIMGKKYG